MQQILYGLYLIGIFIKLVFLQFLGFYAILSIIFLCPEYKGSSSEYSVIGLNPLPEYSSVLNK
jgi:hypothetical protein